MEKHERIFEQLVLEENDSIPVLLGNLEPSLLDALKKTAYDVKNNQPIPFNWALAGHLDQTLLFPATNLPELTDFIHEMYKQYAKISNMDPNGRLSSLWVNFQKKYEFNPVHRHNGTATFAIWVQVPFDIEEEKKVVPSSAFNVTANFQIIYSNKSDRTGNRLSVHNLPVDRSWEGKVIMFPVWMLHCVYPFYTSDDYRISVSGNIYKAESLMTIV